MLPPFFVWSGSLNAAVADLKPKPKKMRVEKSGEEGYGVKPVQVSI